MANVTMSPGLVRMIRQRGGWRPVSLVVLALALPSAAAAQDEEARPPPDRPVPDYDGRGAPPEHPAEPWLWIPRILTAPLYLTSEYLIRQPLGLLLTELELSGALPSVASDDPSDAGFSATPTVLLEFDRLSQVGAVLFWKGFLSEANEITVAAVTGGPDLLGIDVRDRLRPLDALTFEGRFEAWRRTDLVFAGIGPDPRNDLDGRSRYAEERLGASLFAIGQLAWRSRIEAGFGYTTRSLFESDYGDGPSVDERQAVFAQQLPVAFPGGYQAISATLRGALDSRERGVSDAGGVRVGAFGELGVDPERAASRRWLRWGGDVGLYTDALEEERVLGVEAHVALVEELGDGGVPFPELIDPGGDGPLPAWIPGTLRGPAMAALTARYEWPIWFALRAALFASLGNVFDRRFEGFDVAQLRASFGITLFAKDPSDDHPFELLFALGSETFENGGGITSARFLVGLRPLP